MKTTLSERERKCLEFLKAKWDADEERCWAWFKNIAKATGLEEDKVRIAVRSLVRNGYATRDNLFDEDGFVKGSGHCITQAGLKFLEQKS